MDSTPRHTTNMFNSQKPMKQTATTHAMFIVEGASTLIICAMAVPPIHD